MKPPLHLLVLTLALIFPVSSFAQQAGGKRGVDVAREIFLRTAAAHLKIPENKLSISPSDDPEKGPGDLYPWTVWKKDGPKVLTGYSSWGPDAAIAFDGYQGGISQPGGISALLKACHIHNPKNRLSTEQIARHVSFCLSAPATGEMLFDKKLYTSSGFTPPATVVPPALRPQKSGQLLTFITMTHGNTGTWDLRKISVTILPDLQTIIHREDL